MIQNDTELQGIQERIAFFSHIVAKMRHIEKPENLTCMASGHLAEIEKMHAEVMAYLRHHPTGRRQPGGISQTPIYSAGRRPEWNFQTVSKVLGLSLTHVLLCVSIHIRI